jgi:glycolate oxidase
MFRGEGIMEYIQKLKEIVGEDNVFDSECELICYSRDMGVQEANPDVVVLVTERDQVVEIMKLANEHGVPVTPRGTGTSVCGGIVPVKGGIVLDLYNMNKILQINKDDGYVVVEPGVVCGHLNRAIAPTHFFPPDPGSSPVATLGGMINTNASGVRAAKWGTTKDYVMALELVLADGRVINTGSLAPKSSSGYNLTQLIVGSEGTLAIITKATLRIKPLPEYTAFASAAFNTVEDAGKTVSKLFASGIEPSACEILDKMCIKVVNDVLDLGIPPYEAFLVMEVDGHKEAVRSQMERVMEIAKEFGGEQAAWTDDPEERARMWAARHGLVSSLSRYEKGMRLVPIAEDFGVPISRIPDTIKDVQKIADDNNILIATFGHVGDGNLHATFIIDTRKRSEWEKIQKIGYDLQEMAISKGGTISAEHGVGLAKVPFMKYQMGEYMDIIRGVKHVFDPKGILNPGKLGTDTEEHDIYDYFAFKELVENPDGVVSFGEEADDEILACVQCGFCRVQCPIFPHTGVESSVGRGKVQLAYSILTGRIEASAEVADKFYKCTTCANCTFTCPARIKIVELVEKVREYLAQKGFGKPEHQRIKENMKKHHNPYGEDETARKELKDLVGGGGQ